LFKDETMCIHQASLPALYLQGTPAAAPAATSTVARITIGKAIAPASVPLTLSGIIVIAKPAAEVGRE